MGNQALSLPLLENMAERLAVTKILSCFSMGGANLLTQLRTAPAGCLAALRTKFAEHGEELSSHGGDHNLLEEAELRC